MKSGSLAARAYKMVRQLKKDTRPEYKSIDTTGVTTVGTAGSVFVMNICARGDDINNRDGRVITCKSLAINLDFTANPIATLDTQFRVAIVHARNVDGLSPAFTDIFTATDFVSQRNLSNRSEYRILMDKVITLSPDSYAKKNIRVYKRFNIKTIFNAGTAGTVADVETGGIFFFFFSSDNVNLPTMAGTYRLRFIDN